MIQPRVTSGTLKGLRLKVPSTARPFTERVKRVMFDTISEYTNDAICLDLFAGAGSIGIEAISRGAAFCYFVENDYKATEVIKENIEKAKVKDKTKVLKLDYVQFAKINTDKSFDLIFVDPPFEKISELKLQSIIPILKDEGLLIIKSEGTIRPPIPSNLEIILEEKVGVNVLYFCRRKS